MTTCWVDGKQYRSFTDAAKAHNVSPTTIKYWCEGRIIKNYRTKTKHVGLLIKSNKPNCWTEHPTAKVFQKYITITGNINGN